MTGHRERIVIGAYGVAVLVFITVAGFLYVHFQRFNERTNWVEHTLEVISVVDAALGDLKDVETGQRGYLLAGEEDFLEPYDRAVAIVHARLDSAEALTLDNPFQQMRLRALRPVVERKIAFSDHTIRMFRAGDHDGARALVAARHGKLLMDDIRQRIAEIGNDERHLLATRTEQARAAAWRTTALLVFGNGLAFALLTVGTIMLGRELNRRNRIEEERVLEEERTSVRATAERAERRLATVLNELPVAVVIANAPTGEIALQNARMRELTGSTHLDARHTDGSPFEPGTDPLARALRDGQIVRGEELRLERPDQRPATVMADAVPVRDRDGRVLAAVGVFHDLSEVQRTEAQHREALWFRDLFTGALGHELRNPLSVITAGSASLARRASSAVDLKLVNRMTSSALRMERMITQLLELVQLRLGGGITLDREHMDLGTLARNVLDQFDVMYPERTLELELQGELAGSWDDARLASVLGALVANALEHGRADAPVRVAVRSREDHVEVTVSNEGTPIPEDLLPLLFDPFRRAEERKRMKSAGLGIGLYLADEAVRAHGGSVVVTSTVGAGTLFTVSLPRAPRD